MNEKEAKNGTIETGLWLAAQSEETSTGDLK